MNQLSGTTVMQETTNWAPPCAFCASWRKDWDSGEDRVYDERKEASKLL